ncbi:Gas vesicle K [Halothece sp. PCC 7418]|uniref:gas vesicle protein K n=1 Tax=Halothece sp. (strain PCC 7418) TaxID=65093 RepID=UPI0002A08C6F|nr:gas vesicle protein K [Halothece sp. PCC 7418]AFZ42714.1 Gas vesicle K [Halothece sp. PCC 7418]
MSADESNLSQVNLNPATSNSDAGLAPLLLTVTELIRQLMEAQVIRRMDGGLLNEEELDRAGDSLQRLEAEIIRLCEIFEIDPKDLNVDLGELGTLMPKNGGYYPGESSDDPSILELLDRILHKGVVIDGNLDLGIAQLSLIQARLHLVLTSQPINGK